MLHQFHFQPLSALQVALHARGHEPVLVRAAVRAELHFEGVEGERHGAETEA